MMTKSAKPIFAAPSREMNDVWREWVQLHKDLDKRMPRLLADPFFSASSQTKCEKRILVVGKATRGAWDVNRYRKSLLKSPDNAISDKLRQNRQLLEDGGNGTNFWTFFCRLIDRLAGSDPDRVIWSNVAKIASVGGVPSGRLLSEQADLAERTLRVEAKEYRPALTIFLVGNNSGLSNIIKNALGTSDDDWEKNEALNVWWIQGPEAKLWTGHPERKPKRETEYWLTKAQELIDS